MKKNAGFTMVELMIVMEIIVIIAALAIPQIMRAVMSANENSASGSLRNVAVGQASFKTAGFADVDGDGEGDYGTLDQLANPDASGVTPPFIDRHIASGLKSGYVFVMTVMTGGPGAPPAFQCYGVPAKPGRTGFKMYYVDDSNVIRVTTDGTLPGPESPAV
ncbi:MAG: prepilin-type N-terminal cleavage/methylation domain-containing protein [bacterium]|nr:prepilin-type N-terminal cleavage/methylation domain-containing protein [bacterium]